MDHLEANLAREMIWAETADVQFSSSPALISFAKGKKKICERDTRFICIENCFWCHCRYLDISMFDKILSSAYLYFLLSNSMRFIHFLLWQWQRGPMVPQSGFYHQLSTTLLYYSCLLTTIIQCMISNVGFGLLTEAHTSSLYHSGDGILFLCLFLGLFGSDPHRSWANLSISVWYKSQITAVRFCQRNVHVSLGK